MKVQEGVMRIVKTAFAALTVLVATVRAATAQSFAVDAGGTTYNVVGLSVGIPFSSNVAAITSTPWGGDLLLVRNISLAVRAESGPTSYVAHYAYEFGSSGTGF
jgi:hypothetical protein